MSVSELANVSSFSCDHKYDDDLPALWRNNSNWTDWQLSDYSCSYWTFKNFQRAIDCARTVLFFVGGSVGIVSAILALLTFNSQKHEFAAPSFSYHRAINAIELPFMVLMIERAIRDYTSPSFLYSRAWATYFAKVSGRIDNVLPSSVNMITLFIAIERAIACLAPKKFPIINRPVIVWLVVFGSVCISFIIWAPTSLSHTTMYDNRTVPARYMPVWTQWSKGRAYRIYDMTRHVLTSIGSALLVLATISAVIGLRRTAARSFKRKSTIRKNSQAPRHRPSLATQQSEYWLLLQNLSYLQLCETVPLIFLHGLLVATERIDWDFKGGGRMAPLDTTYPEAMRILRLARSRQHMDICLNILNVAAHSFHFYWYLIFCPKVRQGFVSFLQHGWNAKRAALENIRKTTGSGSNQEKYDLQNGMQVPLLNAPVAGNNTASPIATANMHANGAV